MDYEDYYNDYIPYDYPEEVPYDPSEEMAREDLEEFFEERKDEVFYSRQIEVRYENEYFHWVTNRALRDLVDEGFLSSETRELSSGGRIKLMWHRSYRYYKRSAQRVVKLVEEFSDPNITAAIGLQGEAMVLEGFAKRQFVMKGRNTKEYEDREWTRSGHDLDFIFERDSVAYGVEVKNKLGYLEHEELKTKIEMCEELGIRPVFVVRMMPRSWIYELYQSGGFGLILKYQLYPWAHKELAARVKKELGLPVDTPRALEEGTIKRFTKWHRKNL